MKKILITGGAGFLGTYSIEKYLSEGYDITVIDNFSTAVVKNADPILDNVKLIEDDILNVKWTDLEKYDLVLHLASPVGPAGILKHSGKMAKYILDDIYWAIEGAQHNNCPLIFVSTSEIYGYREKAVLLKEEGDKLLVGDFKVRNEYSMAKLLAEIVLSNTAKVSDLQYQIIRPFNISGARQLTVFNDGKQIRAFTHVTDIINGIYLTSQSDFNEIWNVGNPDNQCTILKMAEIVKGKTQTESDITFVDPKTIHGPLYEEAWDKIPDPEKINKRLGWVANYDVDYIINDVINYYSK